MTVVEGWFVGTLSAPFISVLRGRLQMGCDVIDVLCLYIDYT